MNKSDLKHHVSIAGSHFFERSNMKFFGDTMVNYYVPVRAVSVRTSFGNIHMCWELQRKNPVKHGLRDSAYFDIDTYQRVIGAR